MSRPRNARWQGRAHVTAPTCAACERYCAGTGRRQHVYADLLVSAGHGHHQRNPLLVLVGRGVGARAVVANLKIDRDLIVSEARAWRRTRAVPTSDGEIGAERDRRTRWPGNWRLRACVCDGDAEHDRCGEQFAHIYFLGSKSLA